MIFNPDDYRIKPFNTLNAQTYLLSHNERFVKFNFNIDIGSTVQFVFGIDENDIIYVSTGNIVKGYGRTFSSIEEINEFFKAENASDSPIRKALEILYSCLHFSSGLIPGISYFADFLFMEDTVREVDNDVSIINPNVLNYMINTSVTKNKLIGIAIYAATCNGQFVDYPQYLTNFKPSEKLYTYTLPTMESSLFFHERRSYPYWQIKHFDEICFKYGLSRELFEEHKFPRQMVDDIIFITDLLQVFYIGNSASLLRKRTFVEEFPITGIHDTETKLTRNDFFGLRFVHDGITFSYFDKNAYQNPYYFGV